MSEITPEEVAEQQHYNQPLRPQFHYTALQGHIGDATGLFFYRGEYHLFNIFDEWSRKSSVHKRWGHAISTDLMHWTQLPPVLDTTIDHSPGSGSGIVDWNNSSGLRNGPEKTLLLFYTDYKKGSCILYSNDQGITWVRYNQNPVLPGFEDIRDPNVFWYSAAKEWRMVRYEKQGFAFYGSSDLLHWRWLSRVEGFYECPDLFELAVDNSPSEFRWVLVDGDGSYVVGQFDGTRFVAESPRLRAEYGTALYATQTWKISNLSSRPIQIAWLKYPQQSTLTWDGQMSFPVELSLRRLPRACGSSGSRLARSENYALHSGPGGPLRWLRKSRRFPVSSRNCWT
jgi:sucrose-6-phosphate hydrolase SacC (GH32 family)